MLREELLAAQMRLELGEITEEEFAEIEARPPGAHPRGARAAHRAPRAPGEMKIAGVEATFAGDEHEADERRRRALARAASR